LFLRQNRYPFKIKNKANKQNKQRGKKTSSKNLRKDWGKTLMKLKDRWTSQQLIQVHIDLDGHVLNLL
jgi:hypothetical protein